MKDLFDASIKKAGDKIHHQIGSKLFIRLKHVTVVVALDIKQSNKM